MTDDVVARAREAQRVYERGARVVYPYSYQLIADLLAEVERLTADLRLAITIGAQHAGEEQRLTEELHKRGGF